MERTRTGMPKPSIFPARRSTSYLSKPISDNLLTREDFTDVFGGPPRTIYSGQYSAKVLFYDDIFWPPEKEAPAVRNGRNLPEFRIPSEKQNGSDGFRRKRRSNGLLSDFFGKDAGSKTSLSSALSSEVLSADDRYGDVSWFASKIRSRWNWRRTRHEHHEGREKLTELQRSFSVCIDDLEFNSPSSAVSSLSQSDKGTETCEIVDEILGQDDIEHEEEDEEDDDDESMSSYVIEINSSNRESKCESNDIDEAIAWAKQKFQSYCSEEKHTEELLNDQPLSEGSTDSSPSEIQEEMQLLDEKIKLWSNGREADIRLLLSSLHQILWPNSGWLAIPLMNLLESAQIKKAYQKAVLCLHPDKLQQRGATVAQKYIAEKAYSALQDAWAAFLSVEVVWR